MPINKKEITKEMLEKETAEELIALAKAEGIEVTKAEAEAYLAELSDAELDDKVLKNVAGGSSRCWHCLDNCGVDNCPCRD